MPTEQKKSRFSVETSRLSDKELELEKIEAERKKKLKLLLEQASEKILRRETEKLRDDDTVRKTYTGVVSKKKSNTVVEKPETDFKEIEEFYDEKKQEEGFEQNLLRLVKERKTKTQSGIKFHKTKSDEDFENDLMDYVDKLHDEFLEKYGTDRSESYNNKLKAEYDRIDNNPLPAKFAGENSRIIHVQKRYLIQKLIEQLSELQKNKEGIIKAFGKRSKKGRKHAKKHTKALKAMGKATKATKAKVNKGKKPKSKHGKKNKKK